MRLCGSDRPERMARLARGAALACIACLGFTILGGTACTWRPEPRSSAGSKSRIYHTVKPGENLYRIGKRYGVSSDAIARANRIRDVTELRAGQRLYIPRGNKTGFPPAQSQGKATDAPRSARGNAALKKRVRAEAKRNAKLSFIWPLSRTKLTSRFGRRNGQPHEGIDLSAPQGTTIRAAESGKVIHSGRLGAYGLVVIVKHAGNYRSVYAHARKLFVRKGQFVEKSQKLAEVGMTGRTTGPHLHFEIRRKEVPKDPLLYLP
jgi:lipoprotein NlpD